MTTRSIYQPPTVGIPPIDKMIGKFCHPHRAAQMQAQFLPGILKLWTAAHGGERLLRDALAEIGADGILAKARAEHDSNTAALRNIAESLPALAKKSAEAALAAVVRDPNAQTASALLTARAQLAEADKATADLVANIESSDLEFTESEAYRTALVKVFRAIIPVLKKSDLAVAVRLAFRAAVLAEAIETGKRAALAPSVDFVQGHHVRDALDLLLIPGAWVERGCPPGFRWNGESLDFA